MKSAFVSAAALAFFGLASAFPDDQSTFLYPATHSLYHGSTGRLEYDRGYGNITRSPRSGNDISTLVVFYFTAATKGKVCEFNFETDNPSGGYHWEPSNAHFDVFHSSKAIEGNKDHTSNFRDGPMGRMTPVAGGQALTYSGSRRFMCPDTKEPVSYELVPVGDSVEITWSKNGDGPWIKFY